MCSRIRFSLFWLLASASACSAQSFTPVPFVFASGGIYNPSQLMSDFNSLVSQGNAVGTSLAAQIATKIPVQSGATLFFYNTSCPTGWTQYGAAGYFLRGLDNGRGLDPSGAPLASTYLPMTQAHAHSYSNLLTSVGSTNIGTGVSFNAPKYNGFSTVGSYQSGGANSGSPSATMQPKNVALLYCQKN